MFRPFSFYVGLRYTLFRKKTNFVSFISLISILGIALGVCVLITVLSVMNGFNYEIHNHLFKVSDQVTVTNATGSFDNWLSFNKKVEKEKHVVASAPFILKEGMLAGHGASGVMVCGVSPMWRKVSSVEKNMVQGNMGSLKPSKFGVVLSESVALNLGVSLGSSVMLVTPKVGFTPIGIVPRFKKFKVVGIFYAGDNLYENVAFINLDDAQKLFQMGNRVTGLRVRVDNLYIAPEVSKTLAKALPSNFVVTNWTEQYKTYFKAISMEKTTMFVILLFIIAVAVFNLVSTLTMNVTDKKADIAILSTLGASRKSIMAIFMTQGCIIGVFGTLIGVISGILLSLNAPAIVQYIEGVFHTQFISSSVFFINYLPSKLSWASVFQVSLFALIMSFIATIYPSLKAPIIAKAIKK